MAENYQGGQKNYKTCLEYYRAQCEADWRRLEVIVAPLTPEPIREGEECPVVNACFVFKKDSIRLLKRCHKTRIPRKVKKAIKHMDVAWSNPRNIFENFEYGVNFTFSIDEKIIIKKGYRHTKWVIKAKRLLFRAQGRYQGGM